MSFKRGGGGRGGGGGGGDLSARGMASMMWTFLLCLGSFCAGLLLINRYPFFLFDQRKTRGQRYLQQSFKHTASYTPSEKRFSSCNLDASRFHCPPAFASCFMINCLDLMINN
ncbi:hypothetical protein B296_00045506 [Ensete ventricosum]|uniref:DUF4094 domain-containing protein n=1 Tax=Ensete ventricosum TaxID=4639 RepID=A0A426XQQ9_ENSVE|nr:hypothetical protein B296_00045506 [Ensete ventricosum]